MKKYGTMVMLSMVGGCFWGTGYPSKLAVIEDVKDTAPHLDYFSMAEGVVDGIELESIEYWTFGNPYADSMAAAYFETGRKCAYSYDISDGVFGSKSGMWMAQCDEMPEKDDLKADMLVGILEETGGMPRYATTEQVDAALWYDAANQVDSHWFSLMSLASAGQGGMLMECMASERAKNQADSDLVWGLGAAHTPDSTESPFIRGMNEGEVDMVQQQAEQAALCESYTSIGDVEVAQIEAAIKTRMEEARRLVERKRLPLDSMPKPEGCELEQLNLPGLGDLPVGTDPFSVGRQPIAHVLSGMAGETVTIELNGLSGGVDPVLVVYNADCSERIVRNDDWRGRNSRVRFQVPQEGPYVVMAMSYNGRSGDMSLNVSSEGGVPAETIAAAETFIGWASSLVGVNADPEAEKLRQSELMQMAKVESEGRNACVMAQLTSEEMARASVEVEQWRGVVSTCMTNAGVWAASVNEHEGM